MKKLLVLIIAMIYGFSSMGMSVSLHYCCGKLKNVEWTAVQGEKCGMDHKMGTEKCCDSKYFEHKGNEPHDFAKVTIDQAKSMAYFLYSFASVFFAPATETVETYVDARPPDTLQTLLNILYCTYRI